MESMNILVSTIINQNGRYSTSIKDFFYLNTDRTVNTYIIGVYSHYEINQLLLVCRKILHLHDWKEQREAKGRIAIKWSYGW